MNRREADDKVSITCFGIDPEPYSCRVAHPEAPGEYCFPPLASLITAGARLMLMLLEVAVTDLGGTYTMEDTDSMAIVATESGGLVPCPGGPLRAEDGLEAIKALSRAQVASIVERFEALNPYDRDAIPGSILKIEADNFDPATGQQRQLWCLAISAKRYALFLRSRDGEPELLARGINNDDDRWSEHGLGHLLNPTDSESEARDWIGQAWLGMIRRSLNLATRRPGFESRPAVGRVSISSPAVLRAFRELNAGKPYAQKVKPFNFMLACQVKNLGRPIGADPTRFHLIAPFEPNGTRWTKMLWIDQYSSRRYKIQTHGAHGTRTTARVQTYGDVLRDYETHPEAKCADTQGRPCSKQTIGLLQRRHVLAQCIVPIGKESNRLEEADAGFIQDAQGVYTEYPDPKRDEWATSILPALRKMPVSRLMAETGLSRATIQAVRMGRRPHRRARAAFVRSATHSLQSREDGR